MKKYKVNVQIMCIVYEDRAYEIVAEHGGDLEEQIYYLVESEGVAWEDYVTTILSEEEI